MNKDMTYDIYNGYHIALLIIISKEVAIMNQREPPAHYEQWMMDGKWSGSSFLLGSSSLA
jgi:hypothetical protein